MKKYLLLLSLVLLVSFSLDAQRFPVNNDTVYATSVCFRFPWIKGFERFRIEVSAESAPDVNFQYDTECNKWVIDRLSFGEFYRWRFAGLDENNQPGTWSSYQRFYIAESIYVDTMFFRYKGKRVQRGAGEPGLLFMDAGRVAVNRAGQPAYVLPPFDFVSPSTVVRDLKMTHNGTLTALFDSTAIEFTLDGEILWRAPDDGRISGDRREHYHHEFTKLPSGNYLILGLCFVPRINPEGKEQRVEFSTIIEYTPNGEIAWSWNSKDYFTDKDLFSKKDRGGAWDVMTHMNACTMVDNVVYASYRDISRLIVIDKQSKKVKASYGGYGHPSEPHSGTGFFRRQHSATLLSDGNLAVVNNDSIMDPNVVSSVVVFRPMTRERAAEKIFEFRFDFDTLTNGKSARTGNVSEMAGGNLLVNMGAIHRVFEVDREGNLVWDMFMHRYDTNHRIWMPAPQYRVSFSRNLFPTLMTARVLEDKMNGENRQIRVRVWNLGTEFETFTVRLKAPEQHTPMVHRSAVQHIPAGEFYDFEFNVRVAKGLDVEVSSEKNLQLERIPLNPHNAY